MLHIFSIFKMHVLNKAVILAEKLQLQLSAVVFTILLLIGFKQSVRQKTG